MSNANMSRIFARILATNTILIKKSNHGPQHAINIFKHAKLNRHHFATQIWSFGTRMGSQAQVQGKMSEREKIEKQKLKICGNVDDKQKSEISKKNY